MMHKTCIIATMVVSIVLTMSLAGCGEEQKPVETPSTTNVPVATSNQSPAVPSSGSTSTSISPLPDATTNIESSQDSVVSENEPSSENIVANNVPTTVRNVDETYAEASSNISNGGTEYANRLTASTNDDEREAVFIEASEALETAYFNACDEIEASGATEAQIEAYENRLTIEWDQANSMINDAYIAAGGVW